MNKNIVLVLSFAVCTFVHASDENIETELSKIKHAKIFNNDGSQGVELTDNDKYSATRYYSHEQASGLCTGTVIVFRSRWAISYPWEEEQSVWSISLQEFNAKKKLAEAFFKRKLQEELECGLK